MTNKRIQHQHNHLKYNFKHSPATTDLRHIVNIQHISEWRKCSRHCLIHFSSKSIPRRDTTVRFRHWRVVSYPSVGQKLYLSCHLSEPKYIEHNTCFNFSRQTSTSASPLKTLTQPFAIAPARKWFTLSRVLMFIQPKRSVLEVR